jgi:hypothetical protein
MGLTHVTAMAIIDFKQRHTYFGINYHRKSTALFAQYVCSGILGSD